MTTYNGLASLHAIAILVCCFFDKIVGGFCWLDRNQRTDISRATERPQGIASDPTRMLGELLLVLRSPMCRPPIIKPSLRSSNAQLFWQMQGLDQLHRNSRRQNTQSPFMESDVDTNLSASKSTLDGSIKPEEYMARLGEIAKARGAKEGDAVDPELVASFPPPPELVAEIQDTYGDPESNRQKFLEMTSESWNERIMQESAESEGLQGIGNDQLESIERNPDTYSADVLASIEASEDAIFEARIQEAEHRIKVLQAEKTLIQLQKQRLELQTGVRQDREPRSQQMSKLLGAMIENPEQSPTLLKKAAPMLLQPFYGKHDEDISSSVYGDESSTLEEKVDTYKTAMSERIASARKGGKEPQAVALESMVTFVINELGVESSVEP